MKEMLKINITNYLNWEDGNANIDNTYSDHELLAMMAYTFNFNILDVYNWFDLMEYDEGYLLEIVLEDLKDLKNVFLNEVATEKHFRYLVDYLVK